MFTQSLYVLTDRLVALDEVANALVDSPVLGRQSNPSGEHWAHGSDAWVVGTKHHPRGRIVIDVVHRPFPDQPQNSDDRRLYAAWSMGQLGPFVSPGSLKRSINELAEPSFGKELAEHVGFVRLRFAYAPAAGEAVIPAQREAAGELMALTHLAYFISEFSGALAVFNPNGEKINDVRSVWREMDVARMMDSLPWSLWVSCRTVVDDALSGRRTIGLGQWYRGDLMVVGSEVDPKLAQMCLNAYIEGSLTGAEPATFELEDRFINLEWIADSRFSGAELAVIHLD